MKNNQGNQIQIFENGELGFVRVVEVDGEPWWVLKDVCNILKITNSRDVVSRLDEDEKGVERIDTPGGKQAMTVVNESGLYAVVLSVGKVWLLYQSYVKSGFTWRRDFKL